MQLFHNKNTTQPKNTTKPFVAPTPIIQKKLTIGASDDAYEVEADRIADKVVNMSDTQVQTKAQTGALVQRKCADCEEEIQKKPIAESITPLIQKSSLSTSGEGVASNQITSQINSSKEGGNTMGNDTQSFMESRFGTDFSDVRIHTGSNAIQLSKQLNAQAFTVGNDIYFNEGKYNPTSTSGKHLLAHELTHTLQQGSRIAKKIQRTPAEDLISNYTEYFQLDEDGLGRNLARKARSGQFNLVNEVFNELGGTDQDDVAYEFLDNSTDDLLIQISSSDIGRRLLNRLYQFITAGSASSEELKEADRVLRITAQHIPVSNFPERLGEVKIFPFHSGWVNNSVYHVELLDNGNVHVDMTVQSWNSYRRRLANVPEQIATSGIELDKNEIIGINQIDEGGTIIYRPSLIMVQLYNQSISDTISNMLTVVGAGLTIGSGSLIAAGRGASWLVRAAVWGERIAFGLDIITNVIKENRGWIIRKFGNSGKRFIHYNELVSSAITLYGVGSLALGMGKLVIGFGRALSRFKGASRGADLTSTQLDAVDEIAAYGDEVMENMENIQGRSARNNADTLGGAGADNTISPVRDADRPSLEDLENEHTFIDQNFDRLQEIDETIGGVQYIREIELPNGHTWRQRPNGKWCRFSIRHCLTDQELAHLGMDMEDAEGMSVRSTGRRGETVDTPDQLRSNMGNPPTNVQGWQAHHIIPYELRNHPVISFIRRRFSDQWNINDTLNGIYLPRDQHVPGAGSRSLHRGSHEHFSGVVETRLDELHVRWTRNEISDAQLLDEVIALQLHFRDLLMRGALPLARPR